MKKIVSLLILVLVSQISFSQINAAKEIISEMNLGKANGWKIFIPKASEKQVRSAFKKWMKDYETKVIKVKKSDDVVALAAKIPYLGETTYDVYMQTAATKDGVYLTTFIKMADEYLSSHKYKEQSKAWNSKLVDFARTETLKVIQSDLDKKEKNLKEKSKTLEKLISNKNSYDQDIKKAKETIEDRKKKLITNVKDQVAAKSAIAEAKKKADAIKAELAKYQK